MQTTDDSNESVSIQMLTESSNMNSPLEAVRSLAQRLAPIDMSTNDLQTCVLYTLLRSNDFSIEETKRQLSESRNAILESLVLPDFDCNRDLNLKQKTCETKKPDVMNKSDASPQSLSQKLCPIGKKAKKSIAGSGTASSISPNKSIINGSKVRTQKRQLKDDLILNSSKVLKDRSTTSTQTSIESEVEVKTKQKKPLKHCFNQTSTQSSSSFSKTLVKEPIPLIASKRPVQSVRPLNPNLELSNLVTTDSSVFSNHLQSDDTTGSLTSTSVPIVCESVVNRSTNVSNNSQNSSDCLPSNEVKVNRNNTFVSKISTSSRKSTPNRIQLIKGSTDQIDSTSVNQIFNTCAPNKNDISKNNLLKKSEESDNSSAQIITTEAALAALSTICDSNSSINTSFIESEVSDVNPNTSKLKSNGFSESNPEFDVKPKPLSPKQKIGTTFSDQFKLFLDTSKNAQNSEQNVKKNSSNVKKVIEIITID